MQGEALSSNKSVESRKHAKSGSKLTTLRKSSSPSNKSLEAYALYYRLGKIGFAGLGKRKGLESITSSRLQI